jgi:transcriptional regulator with XRE-family HTH domain
MPVSTLEAMPRLPNLERVRLARAYSQADLARTAGVSDRTIRHAERGRSVSLRTLRKLAEVLRVEPTELTGEEPIR